MPIWQVCAMGIGIVFFGLVCLIIMCNIIGMFCNILVKNPTSEDNKPTVVTNPLTQKDKGEIVAAISSAVAEEMGTDVSAIRIKSIKKI